MGGARLNGRVGRGIKVGKSNEYFGTRWTRKRGFPVGETIPIDTRMKTNAMVGLMIWLG